MYSYREQLDVIGKIRLKDGETSRGNCPFCGGKNTFTISKKQGDLVWNCFRASCGVTGGKKGIAALETIRNVLMAGNKPISSRAITNPIPEYLSSVTPDFHCVEWLRTRNCWEAYKTGLVNIKYSPSDDRIMFPVKYNGKVVGYSGRSLDGFPKWKKFGDTTHVFTCGTGRIGVIVEDAPSACAVGIDPKYTGISLLGTILTDQHKEDLIQSNRDGSPRFQSFYVCLDPDAMRKGLDMAWKLTALRPSKFRLIPNDLKYYSIQEINTILDGTPTT